MRFALTDEQIEFSEAVKGLLADTCTPDAVRSAWPDPVIAGGGTGEGSGRVPAAWAALGEMGVLGIMVPEANGGLAMTDEDLSPLLAEAGRVALPDPLASTAGVAVGTLSSVVTQDAGIAVSPDAQSAAAVLLGEIATGAASVAANFAPAAADSASVAVAGSDLVAGLAAVDHLIVYSPERVTLVEREAIGYEPVESVDGARRLGRLTSYEGLVLAEGQAAEVLTSAAFNRAALYSASELVGLAERMVDMSVAYAAERQQFGVAIGTFQAVKHHLANVAMAVEFARPLVMRAAHSIAHGDPLVDQHVSMAKARSAQAADKVARVSLQVHGGIGYTVECDLHLFMKRSWALGRQYGDTAFHTRRVRRSLSL